MLYDFSSAADFFLQNHFSPPKPSLILSNSMVPDQVLYFVRPDLGPNCLLVGPDLGPNCLQRLLYSR